MISLSIFLTALGSAVSAGAQNTSPRWPFFNVTSFSASAQYKSDMRYKAIFSYGSPDAAATTNCLALAGAYSSCQQLSGPSSFDWSRCAAPDCFPTDGWSWKLTTASNGTEPGYNFEVEYDYDAYIGKVYGCKFFPTSDTVCDSTVSSPNGKPAVYLNVPKSFTMSAQSASGCLYASTTVPPSTSATTAPARRV